MNVLITGGTGYFGQGMARRILSSVNATNPDEQHRVAIYSRNEWNQALMRQAFNNDQRLRFLIGDVRDADRLAVAMKGVDLVIHAAALKRVEVGEYNPTEMVRTNVEGAMNVIDCARRAQVRSVVALSSDKACEPLNCYGATKLVAEKLFLAANETQGADGPTFAVARYGNVAGSTGSIIPIWRARLADKQPIEITNPLCTRYWMTLRGAVEMVLWCAGRKGITVPNLWAYRLDDLAEAMMDDESDWKLVGLSPGEKLHEKMISEGEAHLFGNLYPAQADWDLPGAMSSEYAPRMTVEELKKELKDV